MIDGAGNPMQAFIHSSQLHQLWPPNVLYFFGTFETFETIGNIEINETFEDKFKQLEVTGLVKPGKGLAQFCQTIFRQMKLAK